MHPSRENIFLIRNLSLMSNRTRTSWILI